MGCTDKFVLSRWVAWLLSISFGLLGVAAGAAAADYTVELIVYSHLQPDGGNEQWSVPRTLPDTGRTLTLGENATRMLEGPRSTQAIVDALRRSDRYRLLLHWYWQQPGWTPEQAQPVLVQIPVGAALPVITLPAGLSTQAMDRLRDNIAMATSAPLETTPLLDGSVKLIVGEILQVDVDLIYLDPTLGIPLHMKESRRLRSGELHYLDHPRFGVLVRVAPVSMPAQPPVQ